MLKVTREQAQAFKDYYANKGALMTPAWKRVNEAEESGDSERIKSAHRDYSSVIGIAQEMGPVLFREMVMDVFDQEQLDTVKSLCINVVMERVGMEEVLRAKKDLIAEHGLTRDELREFAHAMVEIELELKREIVALRRKAWDQLMAKLPPELVAQLETELGFGGLKKQP